MIQGMSPFDGPGKQAAAGPSKAGEEAKLEEACQQFEEMFLTQMMKQMRKSGPKGGMFGNAAGSAQFADMMDQERADVDRARFGLTNRRTGRGQHAVRADETTDVIILKPR